MSIPFDVGIERKGGANLPEERSKCLRKFKESLS
jgi:hypothetical protein